MISLCSAQSDAVRYNHLRKLSSPLRKNGQENVLNHQELSRVKIWYTGPLWLHEVGLVMKPRMTSGMGDVKWQCITSFLKNIMYCVKF